MDSRSVAIAPLSSAGADDALDHPASPAQAPAPRSGTGSPAHCSRSPIYVFTIPILPFTFARYAHHQDVRVPVIVFASGDRANENRVAALKLGALAFVFGWET